MSDRAPGTPPTPDPLTPPDPGTAPLEGMPEAPPPPPGPDAAPQRPTTRAGRQAAAAARKAAAGTKADKQPKQAKAAPRRAPLETRLCGSLTTIGTLVAAAGSVSSPAVGADGVAIITHAPDIAAALDKVAKDDPRVAAALERMLTAGVWSGLVAAMLPLVLAIASNHGAIPPHIAAFLGAGAPAAVPDPPAPVA